MFTAITISNTRKVGPLFPKAPETHPVRYGLPAVPAAAQTALHEEAAGEREAREQRPHQPSQ